jgi:hypothetical protein
MQDLKNVSEDGNKSCFKTLNFLELKTRTMDRIQKFTNSDFPHSVIKCFACREELK